MADETMLMAHRTQFSGPPESEPVVVTVGANVAVLTLDDGEELRFDRDELRRALESHP